MSPKKFGETFQIVKEHEPVRCEICHQSDQLDLEKNICLRCQSVLSQKSTELPELQESNSHLTTSSDQFEKLFQSPQHRAQITLHDLTPVLRSTWKTFSKFFPHLFAGAGLVEVPLALAAGTIGYYGFGYIWPVYLILAPVCSWLMEGAVSRVVADSRTGQDVSISGAYRLMWANRGSFLPDAIEGGIYRWSPVAIGTLVGAGLGEALRHAVDLKGFFGFGFLVGIGLCTGNAFTKSFFVNQTSSLEQVSNGVESDSWNRSCWFGLPNRRSLFWVNAGQWLVRTVIASQVISGSFFQVFSLWSGVIWYPLLPVLLAEYQLKYFILFILLKLLVLPFWLTFKTHLYLALRDQALSRLTLTEKTA